MKVYISADMEGITGVTHWDEVDHKKPAVYSQFQERMTKEVAAVCDGALEAGAKEIWVKDAHYSGRNILPEYLPKSVKLIRGWSGHPYSMVQELDDSFDGLRMVGYASRAGSGGNPLAHTLSGSKIERMILNNREASEFLLHGTVAAKYSVPLAFLSGDVGLCEEVAKVSPNTHTHATMLGVGDSTISMNPKESRVQIKEKVTASLNRNMTSCIWALPKRFEITIHYLKHAAAYRASYYPGAAVVNDKSVCFADQDYDNIMRFILFCV